jgi:hypothetical protein
MGWPLSYLDGSVVIHTGQAGQCTARASAAARFHSFSISIGARQHGRHAALSAACDAFQRLISPVVYRTMKPLRKVGFGARSGSL